MMTACFATAAIISVEVINLPAGEYESLSDIVLGCAVLLLPCFRADSILGGKLQQGIGTSCKNNRVPYLNLLTI